MIQPLVFIAVNSQALVIAVPLGTLAYKLRQLEVRPNLILQYITYGWSTAAALHSHLTQLSSQQSNLRLFPKTLEMQHSHVFEIEPSPTAPLISEVLYADCKGNFSDHKA